MHRLGGSIGPVTTIPTDGIASHGVGSNRSRRARCRLGTDQRKFYAPSRETWPRNGNDQTHWYRVSRDRKGNPSGAQLARGYLDISQRRIRSIVGWFQYGSIT